jgi:hypothetical protein
MNYKFSNNYTLKTRESKIYLLRLTEMNLDQAKFVKNPLIDERNKLYLGKIVKKNDKDKLKTLLLLNWRKKLLVKNENVINYILKKIIAEEDVLGEEW